MRVIHPDEHTFREGETFTGQTVLESVLSAQREGGVSVTIVRFEDGARTNWHEHPGEQVLIILDGEGRVGTATDEVQVKPGDVVHEMPGERHWHGAAPGQSMAHISITTGGPPTWFESPEE